MKDITTFPGKFDEYKQVKKIRMKRARASRPRPYELTSD